MNFIPKKYLPLFFITPLVVLLDHISKFWIVKNLKLYQDISVIDGFFEITHVRNPGIAFGTFGNWDSEAKLWIFYAITVLAIFLMLMMYCKSGASERRMHIPIALIMGGAIGNMTDRMYRGNVVDFLHFHWRDKVVHLSLGDWSYNLRLSWPSFNVADIAITCGALYLAWVILRGGKESNLMYPVFFSDTVFAINSFELMMLVAAIIATSVAYFVAPRYQLSQAVILDLALYGTIAALIGGRLFHVFVEMPYDPELLSIGEYLSNQFTKLHYDSEILKTLKQNFASYYYFDNPIRILQFWKGGWASHGAFIGLATAWILYLKKHKLNILEHLDFLCVFAGPFVIIFVRLGCLLAGCCFGKPSPFDKWEYILYLHLHNANRWPTQIYSMTYGVIIFLLCLLVYRYRSFRGQVVVAFLFFYGIFRGSVEFLRADADRGVYFNNTLSTGQIVGVSYLLLCVFLYFYLKKRYPIEKSSSSELPPSPQANP